MTQLLKTAIGKIQALSPEEQDAIAARLLEDLAADEAWELRFEATTDEQWAAMAAEVQAEIDAGHTRALDELVDLGGASP